MEIQILIIMPYWQVDMVSWFWTSAA